MEYLYFLCYYLQHQFRCNEVPQPVACCKQSNNRISPSRVLGFVGHCTPNTGSPKTGDAILGKCRGADKSVARLARKQAIEAEDFDVHISYL